MVKVRFAPSPTGFLHLGSARTALFNWLYARHAGGKFLLRVEDTDKTRSEKRFLDEILDDLKWMGLEWDDEPVFQSGRFDIYRKKAEGLLSEGKAFREGDAIIFTVGKSRQIEIDDIIHGKITFNTDEIKPQVMIKSDGSPAYNFCCVVDDAELGITHIIRGDDHLSNTPKQVLFYEALGLDLPKFAHIPLMMGQDGSKLSKRHGAVSVEEYRKEGFLPEALTNYLTLLGWNPGDDREILSREETIRLFALEDMSDVQAKFDTAKLKWINAEYIKALSAKELMPLVKKAFERSDCPFEAVPEEKALKIIDLYKVRVKTLSEFPALTECFFKDDYVIEEKGARKYLEVPDKVENVKIFAGKIREAKDFTAAELERLCRETAEEKGIKAGEIIHPTRMAVSGTTQGAGLFEMMEILGKEKVLERMDRE
ncbi:MAG: glutamate--tRNA ligase [Candidatus Omnitrophota bacterium]